jgi:geranyl-CoA carboxylase alpha subunit
VRVDCGLESGAEVGPHYDSLLAKVIAFGSDREEARRRLVRALRDTFVAGVATTRDFLIDVLSRREFIDGEATTAFLAGAPPRAAPPRREAIALAALLFVERPGAAAPTASWRASPLRLAVDGAEARASVRRQGGERIVTLDGETFTMRLLSRTSHDIRFSCGGVDRRAASARDGDELWLDFDGACRRFVDRTYAPPLLRDDDSDGAVRSPVSGVIVGVEARAGDKVRRGQVLATVEAMKMQYSILAPIDGVVHTANASAGAQAQARAILFAIAPHGDH